MQKHNFGNIKELLLGYERTPFELRFGFFWNANGLLLQFKTPII